MITRYYHTVRIHKLKIRDDPLDFCSETCRFDEDICYGQPDRSMCTAGEILLFYHEDVQKMQQF